MNIPLYLAKWTNPMLSQQARVETAQVAPAGWRHGYRPSSFISETAVCDSGACFFAYFLYTSKESRSLKLRSSE